MNAVFHSTHTQPLSREYTPMTEDHLQSGEA